MITRRARLLESVTPQRRRRSSNYSREAHLSQSDHTSCDEFADVVNGLVGTADPDETLHPYKDLGRLLRTSKVIRGTQGQPLPGARAAQVARSPHWAAGVW